MAVNIALEPALDEQHCLDDIERIRTSMKRESLLLQAAVQNHGSTAAATHSGRLDALARDLKRREAELRNFQRVVDSGSVEEVVAEIVRAIGGELPDVLVEKIYQAARSRLGVEEHLPSPPAHLWH